MDEGGCIGIIIGLAVIGFIITVIVRYVIPFLLGVVGIILGVAGAVGVIVGLVFAIKAFATACKTVDSERKGLNLFKNSKTRAEYDTTANKSTIIYEKIARKSYFLGPCFVDVGKIIQNTFIELFGNDVGFGRGGNWFTKIFCAVKALFTAIGVFVFGTVLSVVICTVMCVGSLIISLFVSLFFAVALLIENIKYKSKKIAFRCPGACKKEFKTPYYLCPGCGITHKMLKPGVYGIFKRKCVCGAVLPLTSEGKGYTLHMGADGHMAKEKFEFSGLSAICPGCGKMYNAVGTKPISIAYIGGMSAGKTTFKVAFLNDFIESETVKYDIGVNFPNAEGTDLEEEYNSYVKQYRGAPIRGTNGMSGMDVSTFSFELSHKKLPANRMIQLYDIPGEVFRTGSATEGWNHYTFSEGAVFLIDPFSMKQVRDQNNSEIAQSTMGICSFDMEEMVNALIETLRQVNVKKEKGKYSIPIALTVNKADTVLLKKLVGDEAVRALMTAYPTMFTDYYDTMDYACRCFLAAYGGDNFITTLDNNFAHVHFFSSSPMGYVPQNVRTRFYPYNVLPIMQWLMLRSDDQLKKAWVPEVPVRDVAEERRRLYIEHPEHYQYVILRNINF